MAHSEIRDRIIRLARRVAPTAVDKVARLRAVQPHSDVPPNVADLARRVTELEAEVQENRQLNVRLAELTDVVQELLLPIARRDHEQIDDILGRYAGKL